MYSALRRIHKETPSVGLVTNRHNDFSAEWQHLCAEALTPSAVSDEPQIHISRDVRTAGAHGTGPAPELKGDAAVHGFWRRGTTAIFDVRITDTDTPSYRTRDPVKVLKKQEEEKKGNTMSCVWLGVELSRPSYSRWMECEGPRRRPPARDWQPSSPPNGSRRTHRFVGSSVPVCLWHSFGRRAGAYGRTVTTRSECPPRGGRQARVSLSTGK